MINFGDKAVFAVKNGKRDGTARRIRTDAPISVKPVNLAEQANFLIRLNYKTLITIYNYIIVIITTKREARIV